MQPDNLLLTMSAKVKVSDFGSARLCDDNIDGAMVSVPTGTPCFMSPEMCTGGGGDQRQGGEGCAGFGDWGARKAGEQRW